MSWKTAASFAVGSFALFYVVLPWWLRSRVGEIKTAALRPLIEVVLGRRAHWIELLGLALTLVFTYFGVRNYFAGRRAGTAAVRTTSFLGRIIARILE